MIALDDRAGSKDLYTPLRKLGLPVDLMRLDSGDVAFLGRGEGGVPVHIGIEYKKLGELITSLRDHRIVAQAERMRGAFDFSYLLVEGEVLYDAAGLLLTRRRRGLVPLPGRMTVNELHKRLGVLHLRAGVMTLPWAGSQRDTLQLILAYYRLWTDCDLDQHKSHIAIYRPPGVAPISQFRIFMQSFKGIGFEASMAIERHFAGNLERAILAPKTEWMKIPGIGIKLAEAIIAVIKGRARA